MPIKNLPIRERPILFSGPMVLAILEGRKTVTRRVVKDTGLYAIDAAIHGGEVAQREREALSTSCPYGQPGDRLWVRESWWQAGDWQSTYPEDDTGAWFGSKRIVYSADGAPPNEPNHHYPNGLRNGAYSAAEPNKIWRHRPSIHMPRWASRILLEITSVRIERLQDISEKQALAEGVELEGEGVCWAGAAGTASDSPVESFRLLWELINGAGSWNANPWVWAVEFKRVTP
ncbi:TPA: hypothetical protein L5Q36_001511 [Pseudomonas aeruginosa]|nr:hypothetical protein [Pseudomonas aeruginosa]